MLVQLLNTLMALHSAGYVHRDIRPDNLLFVPDQDDSERYRLMLIDWAYGCRRNSLEQYNGATHFVSPDSDVARHLDARQVYGAAKVFRFIAGDDLYSWLLVCVWLHAKHRLSGQFFELDEAMSNGRIELEQKQEAIRMLFEKHLELPMWRPLWDAVKAKMTKDRREADEGGPASAVDYTALYNLIHFARYM